VEAATSAAGKMRNKAHQACHDRYAFGFFILFLTAACAAQVTPQPPPGPIVSPYVRVNVDQVQVRLLPSSPGQAELVIQGTLPDQCSYEMYAVESRRDNSIDVSLEGIHPTDVLCAQSLQTIEYTYALGRDLPEAERSIAPGSYALSVNDFQTTFSIP
jgi:hypothetical protein